MIYVKQKTEKCTNLWYVFCVIFRDMQNQIYFCFVRSLLVELV